MNSHVADHDTFIGKARVLADRFAQTAAHHDVTGEFPAANFQALFEAGLLSIPAAKAYGGPGRGLVDAQAVISEIARGEPSTALVLAMNYLQFATIARSPQWPPHLAEALVRRSLEKPTLLNAAQAEPSVGSPSHGALPETRARLVDGAWRITGRKSYVTGQPGLTYAAILAVTEEENPRLSHLLVPLDAPGITVIKTWDTAGMRATASHDVVLDDVAVPFDHLLDEVPASAGVKRDETGMAWAFTLIASVYDGVARSARDWIVDFVKNRVPGSLGAPLSTVPRIRDGIGDIEVRLIANARLLRSIADDVDAGLPVGPAAASVKHVVIENAFAITSLALELGGNPGIARTSPLERHHRDAVAGRAHAPQSNLIRGIAARAVLG
ncbi:acyl-CoA/acyl-ACP dehydrogenase [Kaistia dalseonensis]|uniref:Alkylation response protein AidB-like acyl-CoA dehydrogenase n=1 Tax=Kaistia dalseonensis TaxID=410840 RepID=A0ABU0H1T7_9HYPH|nr:acyl-CoA dehydrogenase family protein [Kaistia dalseonensis]MCX5493700.1 acyl-CoA/acyl-ACP dehydrogenase [Kaistia dalseonensis]MDQ0436263.1 alkylation response protein AidB-like acyl-CoA dehydrogenase [Kaistia dalseonensis]